MKKEVVVFEKINDIVIACLLRFNKRENFIGYFIFDAVEESSLFDPEVEDGTYNLLGPMGKVDSFEDATQLAAGKIFISNDPFLIVNGKIFNYSIVFTANRPFLGEEIEGIVEIIKTKLLDYAKDLFAGKELDNEFIFVSDGKGA